MAYDSPEKAREYQRKWYARRVQARVCLKCEKPLQETEPRFCEEHRQKQRGYYDKHYFKISAATARELRKLPCAICGSTEKPHIDHDHETGVVRGTLCRTCNIGLGMFKDNPELMRQAAQYLEDRSWLK